jgi:hypothetical protein
LDPAVREGNPCELVEFLLSELITDDSLDHEAMLKSMFAQFPDDLAYLAKQYDWAVQRGYLWKGIRAMMWDRPDDAPANFERAIEWHANVDEPLMQWTTYHLLGYEHERGSDAALRALSNLRPFLNKLTSRGGDRLESSYLVNRAFENYRVGEYKQVPGKVLRAWMRNLSFLLNRGVLSIFVRSMLKAAR